MRLLIYSLIVLLIFNLNALVDLALHPEIPYFDDEHLIVGGVSALIISIVLGFISVYTKRLEKNNYELKQIKQELEKSEEHFRTLFSKASDGIFMLSSKGEILVVNEAFARMHGYSIEEMQHMTLEHLDTAETALMVPDRMHRLLSGETITFEVQHYHKDGHVFPLEVSASPVSIKGEVYIQCFHRDISERKQAEQALESLNVKLEKKNRELEQVVYVTSHDLRTPLLNIDGYSKEIGILLKKLGHILGNNGVSGEVREKIDLIIGKDIPLAEHYITASVLKMDALLSGLLQISRLGRFETNKERLDMNKIVSNILDTNKYQAEKAGAKIDVSELPSCIGDNNQINQLFSNLIGNAVKYLNPDRNGLIRVSGKKEGDDSVYCVEDNGIGIPPEHQEKIFEIFYQMKPKNSAGEGLGLTIVQKIIDIHSGKIWVESESGRGSKFYVSLPNI